MNRDKLVRKRNQIKELLDAMTTLNFVSDPERERKVALAHNITKTKSPKECIQILQNSVKAYEDLIATVPEIELEDED